MSVHRAVIDKGERCSGISIHYVDEHYDSGANIFQATCEIDDHETPETLAKKVHKLEYSFYPKIIEQVLQKTVNQKLEIIFATGNQHKLKEVQAMLPDNLNIKSMADIGITEDIPETEKTIEGNALLKARYVYNKYRHACFADDTALEVEVLDGAPGVYSARYAGIDGSQGARAKANINKLLNELDGKSNRNARFRTVIAYIDENSNEFIFEGVVDGSIIEKAIGYDGFGYDPVFIPEGYDITFAQMPLSQKNMISHRANAFRKFAKHISIDSHNSIIFT